jgi:hypothetical protein
MENESVIKTKCIEYVETTSTCELIEQRWSVSTTVTHNSSHKCVWDILGAPEL